MGKSFSQRMGLKPVREVLQSDSMDEGLRNGLWNLFYLYYYNSIYDSGYYTAYLNDLWLNFFKNRIDASIDRIAYLERKFFEWEWHEVYDFIEFCLQSKSFCAKQYEFNFIAGWNTILEREMSGYRIVDKYVTPIISEQEIEAIQEAINASPNPVAIHFRQSLECLSNRENPDYRNSIKEGISAVESLCKLIVGNPKATLGDALKEIESKKGVKLHKALTNSLSSLYGYTSDANGIRHALIDEPDLDFDDAKYMLVSCSAFVNYLMMKASKAGIQIS
jgi:hypothetical protein